ncbi:hypothetical protein RJ641_032369 [Dillenia turbinata]|uniref:BHLH domain-containing protein n=1 Tax=Dillenia turbinata TaxID=194707 RepID=A0AAN8VZX3_9MAGN
MESANLHHQHQAQDQFVGSSSLATPSCYGVGSSLTHAWPPDNSLNGVNLNLNYEGLLLSSKLDSNSRQKNEALVHPPHFNTSMIQDLGFQWTTANQSGQDLQLSRIKDEFSTTTACLPNFTTDDTAKTIQHNSIVVEDQLLHLPSTDSYVKINNNNGLHQLPFGDYFNSGAQNSSPTFGGPMASLPSTRGGSYSQILPTTNVSNLSESSSSSSSFSRSLDMDLHALDLLTSARFSGGIGLPSNYNLGHYKDGLYFMQQSNQRLLDDPNKTSLFITNGGTEAKRPSSLVETKASQATAKKPRSESRTSCPPFKVRKEKLGDRIAALQQLVAPFGKTDTASVLMEAIGYIKFLQNQVETLSVPYMKSRTKACRPPQRDDGNEEPKQDLRSRGLCLVPLSCISYVTNDGGGPGVWPPP